jgi:hypothetical protein
MRTDEIDSIIRRELEEFRYEVPSETIGVPWSRERVESELAALRAALIAPRLAAVEIADTGSPGPERQLWLVTKPVENSYLVVFDPEALRFGLAVAGSSGPPQTVAVWGDLVSTFMAR